MKKLQFKTNINCGGCVTGVTGSLNENKHILSWKVDTSDPSKILTVETDSLTSREVVAIVEKAGFKAEPV